MISGLSKQVLAIVCAIVCGVNIQAQQRNDIIITEIMADPTPVVGLPDAEWIEIHNRSSRAINLQGWRLAKATGSPSGALPSVVLAQDSFLIICTASQVGALSQFGTTVSVTSFPSLTNAGDMISIQDASGNTIHAVAYTEAWYNNPVKTDGGYTLEMKDPGKPCLAAENWAASNDAKGGTPGRLNSVNAIVSDKTAPTVINAYPASATSIMLRFSEPLGSAALSPSNFTINPVITISSAILQPPLYDRALLNLQLPLQPATLYAVVPNGITDCSGNTVSANTANVQLPQNADSNDIIINEVLFDPPALAEDYVELYNRSNKVIDASSLRLANRSTNTGAISSVSLLFNEPRLFFPGQHFTFTTNTQALRQAYTVANPEQLFQTASLPSFPNDKGWVIVLNQQGAILDELHYEDRWHFALLDNPDGVALERLQYNLPTNSTDNWTSAAASAGFGTPTAENSQRFSGNANSATAALQPKVFSPDNDGFDDFTMLIINTGAAGYTANITIYDAQGRPVRVLQRNATVAANASFRWDGLNDKQQRVQPGNYIVFIDLFALDGKRQQLKLVSIVAQKRN